MDITRADVLRMAGEAVEWGCAAVCVPPFFASDLSGALKGTNVASCVVVGYPMGYSAFEAVYQEVDTVLGHGVREIDAVFPISAWKSGDFSACENWLKELLERVICCGALLKVIMETGYLNDAELKETCSLCADAGVHFVKNSTGMGPQGADAATIRKLRGFLPGSVRIKASGGIKSQGQALELIAAGANRIGTSRASEVILNQLT